jgi:hypothetical protein
MLKKTSGGRENRSETVLMTTRPPFERYIQLAQECGEHWSAVKICGWVTKHQFSIKRKYNTQLGSGEALLGTYGRRDTWEPLLQITVRDDREPLLNFTASEMPESLLHLMASEMLQHLCYTSWQARCLRASVTLSDKRDAWEPLLQFMASEMLDSLCYTLW